MPESPQRHYFEPKQLQERPKRCVQGMLPRRWRSGDFPCTLILTLRHYLQGDSDARAPKKTDFE